jgi:hypothetical protein
MAIVTTTKGDMDESLLVRKDGNFEDDNEITSWVEYYLDEELVHRSVHVHLKKGVDFGLEAQSLI